MMNFLNQYGGQLVQLAGEHFYIAVIALLLGIAVSVLLGILLSRTPKIANFVLGITSVLQTIPSLALLAIMLTIFGVGKLSAIMALFVYSLLPILRNTFVGLDQVDADVIDAAKGMGMTSFQSVVQVELPLAAPVIMSGIRLSAVYVVAWTTLASYIGAGGLGDLIFSGLNLYRKDLIIGGTLAVSVIALLTDYLLGKVEQLLSDQAQRQGDAS